MGQHEWLDAVGCAQRGTAATQQRRDRG
jgi:hypothetical protein